jgi:hypothetical protein
MAIRAKHHSTLFDNIITLQDKENKMDSKTSHPQEKLIETFNYNSVTVELVEWADTIWCGKIGYAVNNTDEPDVEKIMDGFMALNSQSSNGRENGWDVCMSVNYLSKERPNGVMIGFLVNTEEQPHIFDIYKVPAQRFMRIRMNDETAKSLGHEPFKGGIPPYEWIGEQIAPKYGYKYADDTRPIFEYYGFWNDNTGSHEFSYLYVSVEKE